MESQPSTSVAAVNEEYKIICADAVDFAVRSLRSKGLIAEKASGTMTSAAIIIGNEFLKRIEDAIEGMVLCEEEVVVHCEEDENADDQFVEETGPYEEVSSEGSNTDNESTYSPPAKKEKREVISWATKIKAVTAAKLHPTWTWKTLQRSVTRQLCSASQLLHWKQIIERNCSSHEKYHVITQWTVDRFLEARQLKKQITTRMLQLWALQASNQFRSDDFKFRASTSWVKKLKREQRIKQRKITRFISKKDTLTVEDIMKSAQFFQDQVQKIISTFQEDYIINTDQTGCEYKIQPKRTLSIQGEKTTEVAVGSLNKISHSYTAQYAVTYSGKLLPKIFLCLQEVGGNFGPRVAVDVRKQEEELGNVHVTCTKSGKLQSDTYQ
ncbi:uncharacterized protein LOC122403642, partial [Colletes gigas]|uniref:uncharacterized protein LOC122403642 n=1 Tax=Colletes gigas TaxID=935657 RepID=UPI001C9A8C26